MLELAQLKGEHSNLGVYRAQAKEVPTLRQTINTLSGKDTLIGPKLLIFLSDKGFIKHL